MSLVENIEELTIKNKYYRKVINTTAQQQLVLMNIPNKINIGMEQHKMTTQFIRIEQGSGYVILNGEEYIIGPGDAIVIAPNVKHDVVSTSKTGLRLYSIYSPPEHKKGLKQMKKPNEKAK